MDTLNFPPADEQQPERRDHDRGFTLSEVIVAIALTGVLVLTIIAAGWTLIRVSRVSDEQASVEAVLGAAADELSQFGWQSCPEDTLDYHLRVGEAATRIGWPTSSVTITSIEYWDITTETWSSTNPFVNTGTGNCGPVPTTAAASRMQRVTVRGAAPGGNQARELQIVVAEIRFLDEQETT
jgi:prepilin-type N-terminal cleavage/methylation domain-containing protein